MPSSWSTRFLANGSSSHSSSPHRGGRATSNDKAVQRPPSGTLESPTLSGRDGERSMPTPTPPGRHYHARSSSHPLPKIFGKKKSLGNFANDTDVPLDEDLVPVLDEPKPTATPTRRASGKKNKADEDDKASRRCMCCDQRVNVPRELDKFRCMSCLTINDLKPMEEQQEDEEDKRASKRPDSFVAGLAAGPRPLPLSVERTRSIIDQCIVTYLEAKCQLQKEQKQETPLQTPDEKENPLNSLPAQTPQIAFANPLEDTLSGPSPPETPQSEELPREASAAIRKFSDFDQFGYAVGADFNEVRPLETNLTPSTPHGPGPPGSSHRTQMHSKPNRLPPPPAANGTDRTPSQRPRTTPSVVPNGDHISRPPPKSRETAFEAEQRRRYDKLKIIFRPLEDYIVASFGDYRSLNSSFSTIRPMHPARARSESNITTPPPEESVNKSPKPIDLSELDAKTLLLGDIGENGTWWTGKLGRNESDRANRRKRIGDGSRRMISTKSPNIHWPELNRWYDLLHSAGENWRSKISLMTTTAPGFSKEKFDSLTSMNEIDDDLAEAREHSVRALLKVTENILKRPSRPLREPEDLRFLLIILANPSLYPSAMKARRSISMNAKKPDRVLPNNQSKEQGVSPKQQTSPKKSPGRETSQHTGLLKRIFGLLAGSTELCHRYMVGWFSRFDEEHFTSTVDLVASFVTHRIARRASRPHSSNPLVDGGLIPDLSGSAMRTSAQLHSAMGLGGSAGKRADETEQEPSYATDWQVKTAAKLMSLLFAANNVWQGQRRGKNDRIDSGVSVSPQAKAKRSGQLLHTSSFYNTLLDYHDMIADFKTWESKKDRFAFCQYPLFLSMGTKIKVLEFDARRQMEIKAREAYFDSVMRQRALDGHFQLRVRRECMVEDSLRQISEAVGSGQEEMKKGLRVHFTGEDGVDAGGLRKEWFLMLVRDIFDPNHGLFVYDDESNTCYFNPNSFETSDQYYLVGALLGLAIYNSTILDIALPPFAFRKLLAAAPAATTGAASISSLTGTKGQMTYTLSDLAEFRPSLAAGLQQLLDFEGDVQETYCRDFVAGVERYGTFVDVPLIPNGDKTPVTNANRHEFVDAYVRYLLDTAVTRQFEPFKRGFFQVCAGNALSLFRAEEIELLVRGSDEALDVDSLRAVAVYENWKHFQPPHPPVPLPADSVPVVQWFWELFSEASPERQRKLLTFVTGTDRIPAVGATSLILRIVAGGDGWGGGGEEERCRFPIARTCFNMLVLWRYDYREQLEEKLWRAVEESEGFGLK